MKAIILTALILTGCSSFPDAKDCTRARNYCVGTEGATKTAPVVVDKTDSQYPMTPAQGRIYDRCKNSQSEIKQLFLPFQTHAECYEKATGKKVNRITGEVSN